MADPMTWMAVASAVGAVGSYSAGRSQEKAAGAQAEAMRNSAVNERNNAITALQFNDAENNELGRKQDEEAGRQRASAAQLGVGLGGSVGDVLEDESIKMQLDRMNLTYIGNLKAAEINQKATDLETQADNTEYAGRQALRSAKFSAAAQLGATAFYGMSAWGNAGAGLNGTTVYNSGAGPRPGTYWRGSIS